MRDGRLLLSALLLVASPVAAQETPWPTGLYSNVTTSRATGDLGGMEARFYEEGGHHMVEFVWCEGWCNETFKVPVTRTVDGFSFSHFQRYADGGTEAGATMRFVARPQGKRLRIVGWQGDEQPPDALPQLLKPAKRPFGITVANGNNE